MLSTMMEMESTDLTTESPPPLTCQPRPRLKCPHIDTDTEFAHHEETIPSEHLKGNYKLKSQDLLTALIKN